MKIKDAILCFSICLPGLAVMAQKRTIGGDQDKHGCYISAGYLWSDIKQDCIRVWEKGKALRSIKTGVSEAYVIMSEDRMNVELYLPNSKVYPIKMKRRKDLDFKYKDYTLSDDKLYVLKQKKNIVFQSERL